MSIGAIQGGLFQDAAGNALNGGSITFLLSAPAQTTGDGQAIPKVPITYILNSSGSVPNGSPLWGNDVLTPTGTFYTVWIYSASGALVRGPENWVIGGASPIDLGTIQATSSAVSYPGALLLNPSGLQTVNGAVTIDGVLTAADGLVVAGSVTTYNGTNTVANGIPSETAIVSLSAQTAAISETALITLGSSGLIRVSWNAKVTTAAGVSSSLGPLTLYYTDIDGVSQTVPMPFWDLRLGEPRGGGATLTSNSTTTGELGVPVLLKCSPSSVVSYSYGYASNAATAMNYELTILVEQL